MNNMQDFIVNFPFARKVKVNDLLFAEFKCPSDGTPSGVWWHDNFFAHILTGELLLKTPRGEYLLKAGDSAFAKKGSVIGQTYVHEDFCELLVFLPDDFIKAVIKKYNLPPTTQAPHEPIDTIVKLSNDAILTTYFQSLFTHFQESAPPSGALLKLKFEELLLNIFSGNHYHPLRSYFTEISRLAHPSIKEIMEANFFSNLSITEFARLCARSLSSFKKEFNTLYNTTPGKWLLQKRLEYSRFLLETTGHSVDEICMESGFENCSHFNRVFKDKYGCSPARYRSQKRSLEITTH